MRRGETTFDRLPTGLRLYLRRLFWCFMLATSLATALNEVRHLLEVLQEERDYSRNRREC